jgi:hypothetical protein
VSQEYADGHNKTSSCRSGFCEAGWEKAARVPAMMAAAVVSAADMVTAKFAQNTPSQKIPGLLDLSLLQ